MYNDMHKPFRPMLCDNLKDHVWARQKQTLAAPKTMFGRLKECVLQKQAIFNI